MKQESTLSTGEVSTRQHLASPSSALREAASELKLCRKLAKVKSILNLRISRSMALDNCFLSCGRPIIGACDCDVAVTSAAHAVLSKASLSVPRNLLLRQVVACLHASSPQILRQGFLHSAKTRYRQSVQQVVSESWRERHQGPSIALLRRAESFGADVLLYKGSAQGHSSVAGERRRAALSSRQTSARSRSGKQEGLPARAGLSHLMV